MLKYLLLIILLFITVLLFSPLKSIFVSHSKVHTLNWIEIFDLKTINSDYIAQGITIDENYIYFTIHAKDKYSSLLIFKETDNQLELMKELKFPQEATHVSDLTIHNNLLYAIDYASNNIYIIDKDKSLQENKLSILEKYQTNINRSGSLEIVKNKQQTYLLITSFLNDNNVYVYDFNDYFIQNHKKLLYTFKSSHFTQGLGVEQSNKFLYQSVNRKGNDYIYKLSIDKLFETQDTNKAIIEVYDTPVDMIEDIVIKDNTIYSSQEETNKIYKAFLLK